MVLRLRLSRVSTAGGARRHKPVYNIVLAQSQSARDGKPMEVLGTYNPIPQVAPGALPTDRKFKDIKIDVSRAKYWLGVGAQPSDTVWRLLSMIGLLEPRYLPSGPQHLKSLRFETHIPDIRTPAERLADKKVKEAIMAQHEEKFRQTESSTPYEWVEPQNRESRAKVPASNTSPQDPNAA